jgi:WD40 repeat protein
VGDASTTAAFSADGTSLVIASDHGFVLWNIETGETRSLPRQCEQFRRFALDKELDTVAVVCPEGWGFGIRAWSLTTGQRVKLEDAGFGFTFKLIAANFDSAEGMDFAPDGRHLAVTLVATGPIRRLPETRIWNLNSGAVVWTHDPDWVGPPMFIPPDGKLLAIGGSRIQLFKVDELMDTPEK